VEDPDGWKASPSLAMTARAAALQHLAAKWPGLDPADREDIAQDTVLALNAAIDRGEPIRVAAAWARTVAHRKAQDLRRGRERILPAHDDEVAPSVALERFVRSNVAVSALAIQHDQVDRLLAALDDDDLQLLWLLEGQGMTHAEAGEVLGLKPDSVKKRLQRLRNRVRGEADDLGLDDQPGAHPRMY
jgi:RNA polymerase sigma factor (sigma-70 family)